MSRQVRNLAAAFRTTDSRAESVLCEGFGQAPAQDVSGVHPAILVVLERLVLPFRVLGRFLVSKFLDRLGRRAVRKAGQHAWHRQRDEGGIFAVAEAAPPRVLLGSERAFEIAQLVEIAVIVDAE